jgi:hypothetical protein
VPVNIEQFTTAVSRARDRIRENAGPGDIAAEQSKLRAMVPTDATEHEKAWTTELISGLAATPPTPPERSALYHEAGRIHAEAFGTDGTTEQQIAALEDARRRIFALANEADEDEAAEIRAMTRALDHTEDYLRDPPWPSEDRPGQGD